MSRRTPFRLAFLAAMSFPLARAGAQVENIALAGVASQSTEYNGGAFPATNAIDGIYNNFTHTDVTDPEPSWQVSLGGTFPISAVVIHNRGDGCCWSRLRDILVQVLDGDGNVLYETDLLNPENALGGGTEAGPATLPVNLVELNGAAVDGAAVKVLRIPDPDLSGTGGLGNNGEPATLSLGEVEVYTVTGPIDFAIIRQPRGGRAYAGGTFAFSVETLNVGPGTLAYQWRKDGGDLPGVEGINYEIIDLVPDDGGVYSVAVTKGAETLLSEDAILDVAGRNLALAGTAFQSTTGFGGEASRAIDGNTSGNWGDASISHTDTGDPAPAFEVELAGIARVDRIVLWNRTDCCSERLSNFRVQVLDDAREEMFSEDFFTDFTFPDPFLGGFEVPLPADTVGRTVRVSLLEPVAGRYLSMAELEVFGEEVDVPATVVREVEKDSFGGEEPGLVTLAVRTTGPGGVPEPRDVLVQEIPPAGAAVSDIAEGGVLNGDRIEWTLTAITSRDLTYRITPLPCANRLVFGRSTFKVGILNLLVTGESEASRSLGGGDLGTWVAQDVGPSVGGLEKLGSRDILVRSSGAGARVFADDLRFIHFPADGDFELTARIDCRDGSSGSAEAGLMVRDTLDPFSANAYFGLSTIPPAGGGEGTLKGSFRRQTSSTTSTSLIPISDRDVPSLPIYLKLKRVGTTITLERAADGVDYAVVGTREVGTGSSQVNLQDRTLVGLAVAGVGAEAQFILREVNGGPDFDEVDPGILFRRGDADASGIIDLSDPLKLLGFLFLGGPPPECMDAADVDDNGSADISDAVANLGYQFLGNVAPAAPGPEVCGADPTAEDPDLGCVVTCAP